MIGPAWTGVATPLDVTRPTGRGSGVRRSLAIPGDDGTGQSAFRRVDLASTAVAPVPPGPDGRIPANDIDRQRDPLRRDAQGRGPGPLRPDGDAPDARAPADSETATPPHGSAGAGAGPQSLTAGRTALLAGAMGVLAQLFGQTVATPSAAIITDGQRAGIQGPSVAGDGGADGSGPRHLTPVETRAGHEAYRAANRAVGSGTTAPFVSGTIEIMLTDPGPRVARVDEVA